MKKLLIFPIIFVLLIGIVSASLFSTIGTQGLSFISPEIAEVVNLAVCASTPIACLKGKIVGQVQGEVFQSIAEASPEAAKSIVTYNQIKGYVDLGAEITTELQVDETGEITEGMMSFQETEARIGKQLGFEDPNAVLYFKVHDASKAILEVERFEFAVSQLSQTTMRNIVGEFELDEILQQREKISKKIQSIVDIATDIWGIKVTRIEIKDIELPENMKRVIARAAEAVRERRANILKAEGEVIAADNLASAAKTLSKSDGGLHLRTLQTLNDLSSDKSNTVIFALPLEVLRAIEGFDKKSK